MKRRHWREEKVDEGEHILVAGAFFSPAEEEAANEADAAECLRRIVAEALALRDAPEAEARGAAIEDREAAREARLAAEFAALPAGIQSRAREEFGRRAEDTGERLCPGNLLAYAREFLLPE